MKEMMLFIRRKVDGEEIVSREFLKATEDYISELKRTGNLISAQPIEKEGSLVLSKDNSWKLTPTREAPEIIEGYYHLRVRDLEEAISIAKANPEFEYHPHAKIELREIKIVEESNGYEYPSYFVEEYASYMAELDIPYDDLY